MFEPETTVSLTRLTHEAEQVGCKWWQNPWIGGKVGAHFLC